MPDLLMIERLSAGYGEAVVLNEVSLAPCDLLFLCLPHGGAMGRIDGFASLAPKIVDLSADFRLRDAATYATWYGNAHPAPELLDAVVSDVSEGE